MRRALGAIVVMGVIAVWNWIGAWSVRIPAPGPARDETSVIDSLRVALQPTTQRAAPAARAPRVPRGDILAFLSTAPADSLDLLPGIGPVLAGRIIDARRARGGFASWNDVLAIKGIGPATVARWQVLAGQ